MASGKCPKCGSANIIKIIVDGPSYGHYKCLSCGTVDTLSTFRNYDKEPKKLFGYILYEVKYGSKGMFTLEEIENALLAFYGTKEEIRKDVISAFNDPFNNPNQITINTFTTRKSSVPVINGQAISLQMNIAKLSDKTWHKKILTEIEVLGNAELTEAFKNIVSYDGELMINDNDNIKLDEYKKPLIEYIDTIKSIASHYNIKIDKLFNNLGLYSNIIKKVCNELHYSHNEVAARIGVKEKELRNMDFSGEVTDQVEKSINLLLDNANLKIQLEEYETLKLILRNIIK